MTRVPGRSVKLSDRWERLKSRRKAFILFMGTLSALGMLVIASGLFMLRMGKRDLALRPPSLETPLNEGHFPSDALPPFEIFSEEGVQEVEPEPLPDVHVPDRLPRIAILIDDLGYDHRRAQAFIDLGAALTFSILPHSPFQKEIAEAVLFAGNEILLHLPMEPKEYPKVNPGPGALLMGMTPETFTRQLIEDLETLPSIKGVNNHMGSRITADRDRMTILFSVLKERGLFFVDSRTTSKSVAGSAARKANLDFARRDVFLDHVPKPAFVEKQIDRLLERARRQGTAIGIAHPTTATYRVLQARLPHLTKDVELVPVSSIIYQRLADANGLEPR